MNADNGPARTKSSPEVKVSPSGGGLSVGIMIVVATLIALAFAFMIFGVGSETAERSDVSTTTTS